MQRPRFPILNLITFVAASLVLAACTLSSAGPRPGGDPPTPTADPLATLQAEAMATARAATTAQAGAEHTRVAAIPSPTVTRPAPSATPVPEPEAPTRTQYTISVDFDYPQRAGSVRQDILYTNNAPEPLPELLLTVALRAFPAASVAITGLWWAEDGQPVAGPAWEGTNLHVPLRQALLPGQQIGLKLEYAFNLPPQSALTGDRPLPAGYTARQTNLVDWYPFVPPYRAGQGWLAPAPAFYGEHLAYDLADFDITLRVSGAPDGLVVAASAGAASDPASDTGSASTSWRFRREGARTFAISLGSDYAYESLEVDGVTVTSYFFPLHREAGLQVLRTTAESLELFNELFGPYPHDTLAVVEADFLDGMEYDGLYFLSRAFYNLYQGATADYLITIAAHETAHQWWFGVVGNDQANQPWLDEALCTYAELIYYERLHPEGLDWWWPYRIQIERPEGFVDSSIYSPPGRLQTYREYRNAVYLNGALFLHDLRKTVGDAAFFAFLKDYATTYAGQIAFEVDFFSTLARHSDADITPLLQKYFADPELP